MNFAYITLLSRILPVFHLKKNLFTFLHILLQLLLLLSYQLRIKSHINTKKITWKKFCEPFIIFLQYVWHDIKNQNQKKDLEKYLEIGKILGELFMSTILLGVSNSCKYFKELSIAIEINLNFSLLKSN